MGEDFLRKILNFNNCRDIKYQNKNIKNTTSAKQFFFNFILKPTKLNPEKSSMSQH